MAKLLILLLSGLHCIGEPEALPRCRPDRNGHGPCSLGRLYIEAGRRLYQDGSPAKGRWEVELGGVPGHSALNHAVLPLRLTSANYWRLAPVPCLRRSALLLARFLPSNLLHALHDDALPLLGSLEAFGSSPAPLVLLLDDFELGTPYIELLSSVADLVHTSELPSIACFERAYAGLDTRTTWYDYGFTGHQAPKLNTHTPLLHRALNRLRVAVAGDHGPREDDQGLLLVREQNRLVLNEPELLSALRNCTGLQFRRLSLESGNLNQSITAASQASALVGMHGSILALSAFAMPGTRVLELFPYAVPATNYQPYRRLSQLLGLSYRSWEAKEAWRGKGHPERPPSLGGIAHLGPRRAAAIAAADVVPPHACCSDPNFLYHIYQDTLVDVPAICDLFADFT